jgi:hypothetical protein
VVCIGTTALVVVLDLCLNGWLILHTHGFDCLSAMMCVGVIEECVCMVVCVWLVDRVIGLLT